MSNIVPTSYDNKIDPIVDADSVWGYDSEWVANVNFLFSAIKSYLTSNITTSDITEWTNLYYTEARVTANTTVVDLWTDKADKSNVLELDNTTVYAPTLDYHPVTKLYADSMGTNINGLTEESAITSGDELIFYDTTAAGNRKIDYDDLKDAVINTSVQILYTWAEETSISNNQVFSYTHSLWLVQADIEEWKYKVFLAAVVTWETRLLWDTFSESNTWGWNGSGIPTVNHIWDSVDPTLWEDDVVHHQANSLKIRVGSSAFSDLDSFKLIIHKIY